VYSLTFSLGFDFHVSRSSLLLEPNPGAAGVPVAIGGGAATRVWLIRPAARACVSAPTKADAVTSSEARKQRSYRRPILR
jgi:hypothetical protein